MGSPACSLSDPAWKMQLPGSEIETSTTSFWPALLLARQFGVLFRYKYLQFSDRDS